ncbi:MAG TPA: PAS domain S-box protein [Spirochaetota bacterium]|nr:PAS domain S-box protein [Spirochaetota bacterium]
MKTILLVGVIDERRIRLEDFLAARGYHALIAANGREAISMARAVPPDIAVTDILMPVMDGFTLCREWMNDEILSKIPFVFIATADTDPRVKAFALSLGAARVVVKPVEPHFLVSLFEETLGEFPGAASRRPKDGTALADLNYLRDESFPRTLEKKMVEFSDSERRYRAIVENQPVAVCRWRPDTTLTYANEYYFRHIARPGEKEGKRWIEFVPEEHRSAIMEYYREISETPRIATLEHPVYGADGTIRWFSWMDVPIFDDDGRLAEFQSVGTDITDRKEYESKIERAAQEWSTTFDSIQDAVWLLDKDFRVLRANAASVAFFGLSPSDLAGRKCFDIVHGTGGPIPDCPAARVSVSRKPESGEFFLRNRWMQVTVYPIFDESGEPNGIVHVMRDITDAKKIEIALQESESILKRAQRVARLGYWTWKITENRLIWSEVMYGIFGIDKDSFNDALADVIARAIHPEDREAVEKSNRSVIEDGRPSPLEYRVVHPDGSVRWIYAEAGDLIRDEAGVPVELSGIAQDITERKEHELAQRESEERYRLLFEANPHPMWVYDLETLGFLAVNDAAVRKYGYTRDEFLSMTIADIRPSEDVPRLIENIEKVDVGIDYAGVWRHRTKGGEIIFVEIISHVLTFKNRRAELVLANDITERKAAGDLLRESEARYRRLIDTIPHGIAVHQNGIIVFCNPAGASILGADAPERLIGMPITGILHPDGLESARRRIEAMLSGAEGLYPAEDRYVRLDGRVIDVEVMATSLNYRGSPAVQVVVTDISEKKRAQKELERLYADLERKVAERTADLEKANKELESFSYTVSHDLRAPLRHINGFLEMLRREIGDSFPPKASRYMDVINDSAKRMGRLIDDLLSFSRMERTGLSVREVNMSHLIDELLKEHKEEIAERSVTIERASLPVVRGDPSLLRVVMENLISNALKFTARVSSPAIEIGYRAAESSHVFYVRDNGAGFDMRYVDRLFGVFQRLHDEREYEGTGIGLATVKSIVQRHGGMVWAEGEPGKGACMFFSLPGDARGV